MQIDVPAVDRPHLAASIEEGPYFVGRIRSAVDMLARRGLVDPDGVGLVGFSRGAYMVYYAITHPEGLRIGAAVVADGVTYSYGEYVRAASGSSIQASAIPEYERQFGHGNFWHNKSAWLEHSPGFNVDRVEAPALFMVNAGGEPPLSVFEILGAFRLNGRTLEYLIFPQGIPASDSRLDGLLVARSRVRGR